MTMTSKIKDLYQQAFDCLPEAKHVIHDKVVMAEMADIHTNAPEPFASVEVRHELQFFEYSHLPPHLQVVSARFHNLAYSTAIVAPYSQQTVYALHYLCLAKDAAVRAAQMEHKAKTANG